MRFQTGFKMPALCSSGLPGLEFNSNVLILTSHLAISWCGGLPGDQSVLR